MSLCCLRPASKYSGCRLRQERPGSALLDKKRETDGERWAIADLQTPADPSPRSCRGEPPDPSERASKQATESRHRRPPGPRSPNAPLPPAPKQKQAQPTGTAVLLSCAALATRPRRLTARRPREPPGPPAGGQRPGERAGLPSPQPPRSRQLGPPSPAPPRPARPHRLHGVLQDGRELGKHPVPGLQQPLPGRPGELLDAPPPPLLRLPGPLQSEGGCGRARAGS